MASGLIYVAIIGMWVAYFLPRWVHDRNEFSGKSIERYKSALRVVANSSPGGSSGSGVIHTDLDHEAKVAQRLMQRRITFAILIISLLTTIVGGLMNSMKITFALIPLTGIIIYVAHVRRQTISEKLYKRRIRNLQKGQSGTSGTNLSEVVTRLESVTLLPLRKSAIEVRGFSKPRRKVSAPAGSRSINKVFLPNSVNATARQCARVVLPTPPAELASETIFIRRPQISSESLPACKRVERVKLQELLRRLNELP